ncbi:MAG: hypothetical protein ACOCV2_04270 [Persicimonas sp.]
MSACVLAAGCVEADRGDDRDFYHEGEDESVDEPLEFTDDEDAYDGISGSMTIEDLQGLFDDDQFVWYGLSPDDPYPQGDEQILDEDCDPGQFENIANEVEELPDHIEGVVTHHPRLLHNAPVCGEEQRYYGSYYLQDETGGILVLKNSRIADFTFGNRVRIRVRGIIQHFDTPAVLVHDEQEVIEPDEHEPIMYEEADGELDEDDVGEVRRVRGEVVQAPTNDNFNEMLLEGNDGEEFAVSIDRELGRRGVSFDARTTNPEDQDGVDTDPRAEDEEDEQGECVEVTGPVRHSFDMYQVLVYRLGQVERLEDSDCE